MQDSVAEFNRFDIVEANFIFCMENQQDSYLYSRLCRIIKHFKPRVSLIGYRDLTENGRIIYSELYTTRFAYLLSNKNNG
jgi:hypothetical protein